MKSFLVKLVGLTATIALISGLIFSLFLPQYYLTVLPFLLLFFFVVTLLIHIYQLNLAKKSISKFTRSSMLITFFKLVIYSTVAVAYIAFDTKNAIPFVVCLMLLYFIYTFFEVAEITKLSSSKQNK
jgi:hypothetical protein